MPQSFYVRHGKRWFDAVCSLVGIVLLAPLFVVVAIAIRISSRGPSFFRQVRTGQFEKPFRIFKFRTMRVVGASGSGSLLTAAGDARIFALGAWLRKTKTDELPQLFNVLNGDMSLVGPRPEVPQFTEKYSEVQKRVFVCKPGITGPSANAYEEELIASQTDKEQFYLSTVMPAKLEIDVAYCQNVSFSRDLSLIVMTITTVLHRVLEVCRFLPDSAQEPTKAQRPRPVGEGSSLTRTAE